MDLTCAISNLQQTKSVGQVQMAVAKKVLDIQRLQGSAAVKLIEAASASMEKAGDQLVAAATGLGGQLDVSA